MVPNLQGLKCPVTGWEFQSYGENDEMNDLMIKFVVKMQSLMNREEGQDLVEYALVVALIGFAAVAGMGTLANDINSAFSNIGAKLLTTA
jgi:pilus assembly protein Flp/PilA